MLQVALATNDRQLKVAIRVAFYSGMRLSEILRAVPKASVPNSAIKGHSTCGQYSTSSG